MTNRPLNRSASFDRTTFRAELPDGWDAELYRNDQLISYVQIRGNGRYEFLDIALLSGQNRFEVVLNGPQSRIRRNMKIIPAGLDSIPPRDTYYWADVQDSGRDLVNLGGVGPSDYLGLRGGFFLFFEFVPYGSYGAACAALSATVVGRGAGIARPCRAGSSTRPRLNWALCERQTGATHRECRHSCAGAIVFCICRCNFSVAVARIVSGSIVCGAREQPNGSSRSEAG